MRVVELNYKPRAWQRECHMNLKRFNVLALHRRAGKTEVALMELINSALSFSLPPGQPPDYGLFLYVAPELKQAKAIAWGRLKNKIQKLVYAGFAEINESELRVVFRLQNGHQSTIQLYGADKTGKIRGLRVDGAVVDEVAGIAPEFWDEILLPALTDRNGWALFIGTPNGINLFSTLYNDAAHKQGWYSARYTCYDTQSLSQDQIDELKQNMTENAFSREMLCDFDASAEDQLLSVTDVETSAQRKYNDNDIAHAPKIIGVDPARFGDDRSVIVIRQGLVVLDCIALRQIDNMTLATRVSQEINKHQPDAVFIDAGHGQGVIDRLRQLGYDVIEVPFSGRALHADQYANKRAEIWCRMADWVKKEGKIINDQALKQELSTPVYWFDKQGRKVLESKDEVKKRLKGGASPDLADALALTFSDDVIKRHIQDAYINVGRHERKTTKIYDPYFRFSS